MLTHDPTVASDWTVAEADDPAGGVGNVCHLVLPTLDQSCRTGALRQSIKIEFPLSFYVCLGFRSLMLLIRSLLQAYSLLQTRLRLQAKAVETTVVKGASIHVNIMIRFICFAKDARETTAS